jgi:pimeloyl-ACP methyl ester carboxylesterase
MVDRRGRRARAGHGGLAIRTFKPAAPAAAPTLLVFIHGDDSTTRNVDAIAAAVTALREHHRAKRAVLVGHSGGAAISGVVLGRHPGPADGAVLAATARVLAITGEADDSTRPALAPDRVEAPVKRGIAAKYAGVPGATHDDIIRRPELRAAIDDLLTQLGE